MELYDKEVEKVVIGTLMAGDAYDQVKDMLTADCFYVDEYRHIYMCIEEMSKDGQDADMLTVKRRMESHGWDIELWKLVDIGSNRTFSLSRHAAELHQLWTRRRGVVMANRLLTDLTDPMADPYELMESFGKETAKFYRTSGEGVYDMLQTIQELRANVNANAYGGKDITGTPTGFTKFDEASAGLHPQDFVVIAAESSQGKTSIALNIAVNASKAGERVAIYSMEMSRIQLVARMASSESGISSSSILYRPLDNDQLVRFEDAIGRLSNCEIFFDDRSTSDMDSILRSIRYLHKCYGISGVMVDYIQLLGINGRTQRTEEQQLGEFARRFKNIAKELDIWVIALSQLSRDKASPEPTDNRLRGSGQLKEAADTVMLIYRPEAYGLNYSYPEPFSNIKTQGTAMVRISKGRNIGTTEFIVGFDAPHTRFYDMEDPPKKDMPPTQAAAVIPDSVKDAVDKNIKENEELPF